MNKTFVSMPGSRQIGNYLVSKNLGEGTFGKVKLGIHMQTQEKVAIKILEKSKISDVADVERVTRQINILKQVRHPNIIQLYEIIETPKQLFLVMEYVSEGELFEHIVKKKRLRQSQACEFFQQIIAGVQYLHELGVVHRDLKPENLLVDFNKRLKLVDFGLSNTYKQRQFLKTACGSPCYAAPEMISGKKYEGLNADIWSCGIILYAMVCGYLPFQDPNTSALYKKILSGQFAFPKFVSGSAKDLIKGILTTDPNKRFSLRSIKNHEWFLHYPNPEFYNIEKPPFGIKSSLMMIPVDEKIITHMKEFDNASSDQVQKFIKNNRHNHTVTVYYLLMKKNLRLGLYSSADIGSPNFDRSTLQPKHQQLSSPKFRNEEVRNIDQAQAQNRSNSTVTATGSGLRSISIGSRAVNRINLRDRDYTQNNNYLDKKKNDSVQLKIGADNLPIVDNASLNSNRVGHRRQLNIRQKKQKKQQATTNFYDVEETFQKFRHTIYPTQRPIQKNITVYNDNSGNNRSPISFRTSINRYSNKTRQNDRYASLDVSKNDSFDKNLMNKTFVGRIPKNSTPKWEDESERIRQILNKTITGHGSRRKRSKNSAIN